MRFPLVLVLLALTVAGCDKVVPKACSAVGVVTGVSVDLTAFQPTGTPTVVACVREKCKPVTPGTTDLVEDPTLGAGTVPVTLTVDGVLRGSASVTPHKVQPNGPDCGPTGYVGSVRVTAAGALVAA